MTDLKAEKPGGITYLDQSPFSEDATTHLVDTLEWQYEEGRSLDPRIVFELVNRLLKAEGLTVLQTSSSAARSADRGSTTTL